MADVPAISWPEEDGVMTTNVRYVPEDRVIDLAKPLADDDYQLITGLHGTIKRGDQVLLCLREGTADPEMTVRRHPWRADRFVAAHFPGGGHEGGHPIVPETPEHRRQKDYWARAAANGGLSAATEVYVKGAGVLDVVITGGAVATDVEVQHSAKNAAEIKRRTTRYRKAGYLPVWFNDAGPRPMWLREVPAVACSGVRWDKIMPGRRTVTAEGVAVLREVRCQVGAFGRSFEGRCPVTGGWPCGRIHPEVTAGQLGLIDDVASMVPAGELVPLAYFDRNVFLALLADFIPYQEMTDGQGEWPPEVGKAQARARGGQRPQPCRNPGHDPAAGPEPTLGSRPAHTDVRWRDPRTGPGHDDADPYGFGAWHDCAGCQRPYRPAHPSGRCHNCRYPGGPHVAW
jgi:hypothetical protein